MRLLICTQVYDPQDPNLGFFARWVEEFAKHCEQVTVICLRTGEFSRPQNVRVFPLRGGRLARAYKLIKGAYVFRHNYDAVLVHMNPEYLIAAGWLWRLLHKHTVLWYMHKAVNLRLRIAEFFVNDICTASQESFRLPTRKLHIVGHGIDTDFFTVDSSVPRGTHWLSAGRLSASKRHDLAIREATQAGKELRILGDGPERGRLEALAQELGARVVFVGGQTHTGVRDEFRRAALFLHTSETGSLDKMVLEAIACGCPVQTKDPALKFLEHEGPEYVRREHSLKNLIPRILELFAHV